MRNEKRETGFRRVTRFSFRLSYSTTMLISFPPAKITLRTCLPSNHFCTEGLPSASSRAIFVDAGRGFDAVAHLAVHLHHQRDHIGFRQLRIVARPRVDVDALFFRRETCHSHDGAATTLPRDGAWSARSSASGCASPRPTPRHLHRRVAGLDQIVVVLHQRRPDGVPLEGGEVVRDAFDRLVRDAQRSSRNCAVRDRVTGVLPSRPRSGHTIAHTRFRNRLNPLDARELPWPPASQGR